MGVLRAEFPSNLIEFVSAKGLKDGLRVDSLFDWLDSGYKENRDITVSTDDLSHLVSQAKDRGIYLARHIIDWDHPWLHP